MYSSTLKKSRISVRNALFPLKHTKVLYFCCFLNWFNNNNNNIHHSEFHQYLKQESDPVRDLTLFDNVVYVTKVRVHVEL